jgi:hypothetical protein
MRGTLQRLHSTPHSISSPISKSSRFACCPLHRGVSAARMNIFTPIFEPLPKELAGRLQEILNMMGVVPPSENFATFERVARAVAREIVGPHYSVVDAADRLWTTARIHKLIDEFGDDAVQLALNEAFADRTSNEELDAKALDRDATETRKKSIRPTPYKWRDPRSIPRRQFIYGHIYQRGFVTATLAPGGLGKTSLCLAESIAITILRPLLGVQPCERVNSWYWNGEDPREEMERRMAAIFQHFEIKPEELDGRFFLDSGHDLPIKIAEMNGSRVAIASGTEDEIAQQLIANKIALLQIDPFVSCHSVPENDNGAIDAVTKTWGRIAHKAQCAISLVHHVRKGARGQEEWTVEDGRGAIALINAARFGRVLNPMSENEAKSAGIDLKSRREFFRVDNGKTNMTRLSEEARWFRIVSEIIANEDDVGVITDWSFPSPFDCVTVQDMHRVRAMARNGAYRRASNSKDWIGKAVAEVLGWDLEQSRDKLNAILRAWYRNAVLAVERRKDATSRDRDFVIPGSWNEEG